MKPETFQAGRYYIGDPCYVLPDKDKDEFYNLAWEGDEVFQFKGLKCFCASTTYGDGCYKATSTLTRAHIADIWVDSGLIALIPLSLIDFDKLKQGVAAPNSGYIIQEFWLNFAVEITYTLKNNKVFRFYDIKIKA